MKKFSKRWIVGVFVLAGIGGFIYWSGLQKNPVILENTITVKRGDVLQEVSVTGRVKPVTAVNVSFEKAGRIQGVYRKVGDHVTQGTLLAEVESSSAQAALMEEQARLAELKRGSRPEEIAVKEAELAKSVQDLANTYNDVLDTVQDAFTKSDEALHAKTTGIFSGSKSSSYALTFSVCDSQLALNTVTLRGDEESDLSTWRTELSGIPLSPSSKELEALLDKVASHVNGIKIFLETLSRALTLDCTLINAGLDTYRTNVNTARTNTATALASINTQRQSIASLNLAVQKTRNELSLLRAGTASEVTAAQEARVLSAQGELQKYRIYAPITGLITEASAKTGESASVAIPVFNIISDTFFEMEANVPESDIAKIAIGNEAKITLDAYGSDVVFAGNVVTIDPAETIIENVSTYKTTLHFLKKDPRIKSGMTANIDIKAAERKDALIIPARAINTKDGGKFVFVVNADESKTETPVTVGLKGSDGMIEILSGLEEGATISTASL
ncbi:MAG: RND family efflux transporter MFP subunit [Parcubacteria group bacterium GW2011_GWA1_47_8]|nr:MAG: RND family efflux transporter MFP subunit [Parcubacteria group bacterium GW2011_GWA1_47_8]